MAYNLKKETHRDSLRKEVDYAFAQLRSYRDKRNTLIKDYAGYDYGVGDITGKDHVANLTFQTASIYRSWLVANRPQVKIFATSNKLAPFAKRFEVNLNNLIKIINLQHTISNCVLNSLFKIGICKVGLGSQGFVQLDDDSYSDPGFPFAQSISLDNWAHDMRATSLRTCRWMGDFYEIDEYTLVKEGVFNKETRDKLLNEIRENEDQGTKAADLGRSSEAPDTLFGKVRLIDIWVPSEQAIYTMDANLRHAPLNIVDYSGNSEGPYKFLYYDEVPDNTMPVAPLENTEKLYGVINSLLRKNVDQAMRAKQVNLFEKGSEGDAAALNNAQDGEYIGVSDPERVKQHLNGAVDQNTFAFATAAMKLADRMAGNIQTLGGLGPQSDSVGQEQIIKAQVGALMQNMQSRVVKFTSDVCSELGWHLWHDKVGMKASATLEDFGLPEVEVPLDLEPGMRDGDFSDYDIQVEPYSMAYQSPGERMNTLNMLLMQTIFPLTQTPFAQQSGMSIDVKKLVERFADLSNLPELRNVVTFAGVPMPDPPTAGGAKHKPQREYVHRSQSNRSEGGFGDEAVQMMGNAQADNRNK